MDLRAVDDTLCRSHNRDRIIFCKAFHDALFVAFFEKCKPCSLLGAEEDVHVWQDLLDTFSCFIACPQVPAEIHVKGNERSGFFKPADHLYAGTAALRAQRQRDTAGMETAGG